jgi:hypothetical protein
MNRFKYFSKIIISNLLIFFLLSEITGLFIYFNQKSHIFYSDVRLRELSKTDSERESNSRLILHPILGQIRRPGTSVKDFVNSSRLSRMYKINQEPTWVNIEANDYGFFSPYEYPYSADNNPYIIAVFGGSVAQWFSLQSSETLIKAFEAHAQVGERPIKLINFAQGGYKQPQQLQALTYFLSKGQSFDFVVNIDGFNEVALAHINIANKVDPALPNSQTLLPLVSLSSRNTGSAERLRLISKLLFCKRKLAVIADRLKQSTLASYWLVQHLYEKIILSQKLTIEKKLSELSNHNNASSMHLNTWLSNSAREIEYKQIADLWMNASTTMSDILKARGIPYLHVIQPNQYFSIKPLSKLEKIIAIDPNSPYSEYVKKGYPLLIDRIPLLQNKGVRVVSAISIFDHTDETIYYDTCCHFNQQGNEILANFVSKHIQILLTEKSSQ